MFTHDDGDDNELVRNIGFSGPANQTGKLQALVYDIFPSTTAVFSYATGSRKLSANEQFFVVGVQAVVSLLQTTQIISDVCFITDHVAYASWNQIKIVWIETEEGCFDWRDPDALGLTLALNGARRNCASSPAHSQHRFPAPSSTLCQIYLRHWRGTLYLRAAVHRRGQRPPKGFGTNMTVEAT